MTRFVPWLPGAVLLATGCSASNEHPPTGSKPLSDIRQIDEKSGPGTVVSADIRRCGGSACPLRS